MYVHLKLDALLPGRFPGRIIPSILQNKNKKINTEYKKVKHKCEMKEHRERQKHHDTTNMPKTNCVRKKKVQE